MEDVSFELMFLAEVTSAVGAAVGQFLRVRYEVGLQRGSRVLQSAFRADVLLAGKLPVFDGLVVEKIDLPLAAIGTILAGQGRRLVGSPSDATTSSMGG